MNLTLTSLMQCKLLNNDIKKSIKVLLDRTDVPNKCIFCRCMRTKLSDTINYISAPIYRESPHTMHKIFQLLIDAFAMKGFKSNRHNSIFTFMNYITADDEFGSNCYIFIPDVTSKLSFTFSPIVHDLFTVWVSIQDWNQIFPDKSVMKLLYSSEEQKSKMILNHTARIIEFNDIARSLSKSKEKKYFNSINADALIDILQYVNEKTAIHNDFVMGMDIHSEIFFNCRGWLIDYDKIEKYYGGMKFDNIRYRVYEY